VIEMNDKQRLEAIKKDLEKRIKNMRNLADNGNGWSLSFDGVVEIFEYMLTEYFGRPCANCGEKCIPDKNANGRCKKCQERYDEGIG